MKLVEFPQKTVIVALIEDTNIRVTLVQIMHVDVLAVVLFSSKIWSDFWQRYGVSKLKSSARMLSVIVASCFETSVEL